MKKIAILGSTGSIGTQALDIVKRNRDRFRISALTCGRQTELLAADPGVSTGDCLCGAGRGCDRT